MRLLAGRLLPSMPPVFANIHRQPHCEDIYSFCVVRSYVPTVTNTRYLEFASAISCLDLMGAQLPFVTRYFGMHGENYAGIFWQVIILALMVIALIALVD